MLKYYCISQCCECIWSWPQGWIAWEKATTRSKLTDISIGFRSKLNFKKAWSMNVWVPNAENKQIGLVCLGGVLQDTTVCMYLNVQ